MWVVTGDATDTAIVRVVAFAESQTIRLEAQAGDVGAILHHYFFESAMALSAKMRGVVGRHVGEFFHLVEMKFALRHTCQMLWGRNVAVNALHAGRQFVEAELLAIAAVGGVTAKAA
jgi:hypothetical protein